MKDPRAEFRVLPSGKAWTDMVAASGNTGDANEGDNGGGGGGDVGFCGGERVCGPQGLRQRAIRRRAQNMPVISMFYGLVVMMFFDDCRRHQKPHIHVEYQNHKASISIPDGKLLRGSLPPAKLKLVAAWIEIHREELMADWSLAARKEPLFKIEPLK